MPRYADIFRDPLDILTFEDINEFCNHRIAECTYLDYKTTIEDLGDIGKDVAAMANAEGGLIVVGVKTKGEDNGKPGVPSEVIGILDPEKLAGAIGRKCANVIHPSLVPEIHFYKIHDLENRFVMLIRIPQSVEAPHWLGTENKCTVPIRTNDFTVHKNGIQLLTPSDLNSYYRRREQLEKKSQEILERAKSRASASSSSSAFVAIGILPALPKERLLDWKALKNLAEDFGFDHRRHLQNFGTAQETYYVRCLRPEWRYEEITLWGSIFQCVGIEKDRETNSFNFEEVLMSIHDCTTKALSLYESCNFSGNLRVEIELITGFDSNGYYTYKTLKSRRNARLPIEQSSRSEFAYKPHELNNSHFWKAVVSDLLFACDLGTLETEDVITEETMNRITKTN